LQQAWLNLRGQEMPKPELRQPLLNRYVAHPLYAGFFLAFWATPHMTAGHLLLAIGLSAYMLVAIRYEEHDLTGVFGDDYRRYRSGVGMLIPRFRRTA
jgi:protein-S-isoprenylcysteine O-methyltransferase Ste14